LLTPSSTASQTGYIPYSQIRNELSAPVTTLLNADQGATGGIMTAPVIPVTQSSTPSETVYSVNPAALNTTSSMIIDPIMQARDLTADMVKKPIALGVPTTEVPNLLKKFPGIPMYFEMVDSSGVKMGITTEKFMVGTLRLTPNPETLSISSGKKINRYNTLTSWVEEHWGDEIENVSFSGSTFSFMTLENGLTYEFRDQTDAYSYMRVLVHYFQVNGCIYQNGGDYESSNAYSVQEFLTDNPSFAKNHPRKRMIKERLYVKLYYDYLIMYGRFDTFDIIEDSSIPFRFKYNVVFKAERTVYNLDGVPNPGSSNTIAPNPSEAIPSITTIQGNDVPRA